MPVTRGLVALISAEDADRVMTHRWQAHPRSASNGGFYVIRASNGKTTYLHRFILGAIRGQLVDHADGDGLNNTRSNLRIADATLNLANRVGYTPISGFRGVYPTRSGRYRAVVHARGVVHRGGTFVCAAEAGRKYDQMATDLFGAFATLNFPTGVRGAR